MRRRSQAVPAVAQSQPTDEPIEQTITIKVGAENDPETREVSAFVLGSFALHPWRYAEGEENKGEWSVTFVPAGLRFNVKLPDEERGRVALAYCVRNLGTEEMVRAIDFSRRLNHHARIRDLHAWFVSTSERPPKRERYERLNQYERAVVNVQRVALQLCAFRDGTPLPQGLPE